MSPVLRAVRNEIEENMVLSLIVCCFLLVDRGLFCDSSASLSRVGLGSAYLLKGALGVAFVLGGPV